VRRTLTALATAGTLTMAVACGSTTGDEPAGTDGGEGPDQVTVGLIPIVDVAPVYVGQEQGFFEERGIELTIESGQGGAAILPGVVSGQFQFGFSNMTSLLLAQSQGLELQVVAAGNYSTGEEGADFGGVVVTEDSPIQSAADLAGATVAVNTLQNIGDTTVRESIRQAGADPSTVEFVELAFPDMPAALAGGEIDAAWVVEPFLTITRSEGARVVAWNFVDTAPDLLIASYFTSDSLAEEAPDLVDRFAEAMNESLAYTQENPDAAREILTSYTALEPELIDELTLPVWSTDLNRESVQTLADLALEDGLIDEQVDLDALIP
jgi:NitT/TauT family transport system substrate-binding protein